MRRRHKVILVCAIACSVGIGIFCNKITCDETVKIDRINRLRGITSQIKFRSTKVSGSFMTVLDFLESNNPDAVDGLQSVRDDLLRHEGHIERMLQDLDHLIEEICK